MKSIGMLHKEDRKRIGTRRIIESIVLLLLLLFGIIWSQGREKQKELLIAAAASMKPAMEELLEDYRKQHPEIKIQITYGGSGTLEQQIRQGAPIDLFLSASVDNMDTLGEDDLIIDKTRVDLLQNQLVLIESINNTINLQGFNDLVKASRIAMGDPRSVPAGKYAYEVCQSLGLWEDVEKLVVYGKDVTEVLTWVASGNADVGMVYSTEASLSDQVRIVTQAPEGSHSRIIYCAAVVKETSDEREGMELINYLISPGAQEVFFKYGFLPIE